MYCDFKPDNLIQQGDDVKLIDLGGVRRFDDPDTVIYGTVGFQAPEIADAGPGVTSDLYTVGRTLAVLTMDFRGYQSAFKHALPAPEEQPVLARYPALPPLPAASHRHRAGRALPTRRRDGGPAARRAAPGGRHRR